MQPSCASWLLSIGVSQYNGYLLTGTTEGMPTTESSGRDEMNGHGLKSTTTSPRSSAN